MMGHFSCPAGTGRLFETGLVLLQWWWACAALTAWMRRWRRWGWRLASRWASPTSPSSSWSPPLPSSCPSSSPASCRSLSSGPASTLWVLCSGPQAPTLSPTLMHSPLSHSHLLINLDSHPFVTQSPSHQPWFTPLYHSYPLSNLNSHPFITHSPSHQPSIPLYDIVTLSSTLIHTS